MGSPGRPAHAAPPSKPSQPYASKATPRARRVPRRSPQPLALVRCLSVARPLPALSSHASMPPSKATPSGRY